MWLYYGKGGLLRVRKVLQRRHACELSGRSSCHTHVKMLDMTNAYQYLCST